LVANQIDRCPAGEMERARVLEPAALFISATADLGLQHLRQELRSWPADGGGITSTTSGH
jgi:GTP-binding protein HflX